MKKVALIFVVVALLLAGCVTVEVDSGYNTEAASEHKLEFIESKNVVIYDQEYVALFYDYTNNSGETAIPCEWIDVNAFQNGVELVVTVFTGDKTEGAVQCDTRIQTGTTTRVVWLFERVDDSPVSVEMTDGQKFTVE